MFCALLGQGLRSTFIGPLVLWLCHMTVPGCDKRDIYSAASLWYHTSDIWHGTTFNHVLLTVAA